MKIYLFHKSHYDVRTNPIEAVEVVSTTAKSVMIRANGRTRRESRDSEWQAYRDTWGEIKALAAEYYFSLQMEARLSLDRAIKNSAKIVDFIAKAEEASNAKS